jgi:hypothetical protein
MVEHWDGTHPEDVLTEEPEAEWDVLVEETTSFGPKRDAWRLTTRIPCESREEARKRARRGARSYTPEHPAMPRGRTIYQIGNDTWLVHIRGATSDFTFRVSAARLIADLGGGRLPDEHGAVL